VGLDAVPTDGCTLNACDDGTLSVGYVLRSIRNDLGCVKED